MGVTLGKGSNQSQATSKFKRAVATVQVLNRTERKCKENNNDSLKTEQTNHLRLDADDKEETRSVRSFLSTADDDRDDDTKSVRSFNFVYRDTTDAWAALRAGQVPEVGATNKEFSVVDSGFSGYKAVEVRVSDETEEVLENHFDKKKEEEPFDIPYEPPGGWENADEIMYPTRCTTCNKTGGILHPCRICDNAYHESCMERIGRLHGNEAKEFFKRARTNTGWSCHDCECLGQMLHQDDMVELIEVFDKADVDDDATIDLDEFVKYRQWLVREREGRDLTPYEVDDETVQFRAMDTDRTGALSWWEFLDHEAVRRLAAKKPKQLVKLLTPKEIQKARDNFRAFDTDLDGSITEFEARRAYKRWYSNFVPDPEEMTPEERRRLSLATDTQNIRQLSTHIHANTSLLMGADKDKSGTISWEEYLCEQALYVIAARPNVGPIQLKNRKPSFAR